MSNRRPPEAMRNVEEDDDDVQFVAEFKEEANDVEIVENGEKNMIIFKTPFSDTVWHGLHVIEKDGKPTKYQFEVHKLDTGYVAIQKTFKAVPMETTAKTVMKTIAAALLKEANLVCKFDPDPVKEEPEIQPAIKSELKMENGVIILDDDEDSIHLSVPTAPEAIITDQLDTEIANEQAIQPDAQPLQVEIEAERLQEVEEALLLQVDDAAQARQEEEEADLNEDDLLAEDEQIQVLQINENALSDVVELETNDDEIEEENVRVELILPGENEDEERVRFTNVVETVRDVVVEQVPCLPEHEIVTHLNDQPTNEQISVGENLVRLENNVVVSVESQSKEQTSSFDVVQASNYPKLFNNIQNGANQQISESAQSLSAPQASAPAGRNFMKLGKHLVPYSIKGSSNQQRNEEPTKSAQSKIVQFSQQSSNQVPFIRHNITVMSQMAPSSSTTQISLIRQESGHTSENDNVSQHENCVKRANSCNPTGQQASNEILVRINDNTYAPSQSLRENHVSEPANRQKMVNNVNENANQQNKSFENNVANQLRVVPRSMYPAAGQKRTIYQRNNDIDDSEYELRHTINSKFNKIARNANSLSQQRSGTMSVPPLSLIGSKNLLSYNPQLVAKPKNAIQQSSGTNLEPAVEDPNAGKVVNVSNSQLVSIHQLNNLRRIIQIPQTAQSNHANSQTLLNKVNSNQQRCINLSQFEHSTTQYERVPNSYPVSYQARPKHQSAPEVTQSLPQNSIVSDHANYSKVVNSAGSSQMKRIIHPRSDGQALLLNNFVGKQAIKRQMAKKAVSPEQNEKGSNLQNMLSKINALADAPNPPMPARIRTPSPTPPPRIETPPPTPPQIEAQPPPQQNNTCNENSANLPPKQQNKQIVNVVKAVSLNPSENFQAIQMKKLANARLQRDNDEVSLLNGRNLLNFQQRITETPRIQEAPERKVRRPRKQKLPPRNGASGDCIIEETFTSPTGDVETRINAVIPDSLNASTSSKPPNPPEEAPEESETMPELIEEAANTKRLKTRDDRDLQGDRVEIRNATDSKTLRLFNAQSMSTKCTPVVTKYACGVCKEAFHNHFLLRKHAERHSNPDKLECDECKRLFYNVEDLSVHVNDHVNRTAFAKMNSMHMGRVPMLKKSVANKRKKAEPKTSRNVDTAKKKKKENEKEEKSMIIHKNVIPSKQKAKR